MILIAFTKGDADQNTQLNFEMYATYFAKMCDIHMKSWKFK